MSKFKRLHHPTPKQRAMQFLASTKNEQPPLENKTYENDMHSLARAVAEFEPMGGVLIAYPGTIPHTTNEIQLPPGGSRAFGIPNELIVRMQQNDSEQPVQIFVMCADFNQRDIIVHDLQKTAAELDIVFRPENLHLVPWDTDTYWTRDYAPWWIYNQTTDNYGIVKHGYTTLGGGSVGLDEGAEGVDPRVGQGIFRPNDDFGAVKLSDFLYGPIRKWNNAEWPNGKNVPPIKLPPIKEHNWYYLGLLDVGGNYMVTGNGTLASSYLVATQNELPVDNESETTDPDQKVVDERMEYILGQFNRFMGIHTYHVLTDPTGSYIGHIDCWGKFLSENKVLIARSEIHEINKQFDKISDFFIEAGFEVYRVMCQNIYIPNSDDEPATTAAYTNSLILNDHVYVPMAGQEYGNYDKDALSVYKLALPNHTIIPIIGKPESPWLGTDAMHCRTHGIPRTVIDNWLKSQKLPNS